MDIKSKIKKLRLKGLKMIKLRDHYGQRGLLNLEKRAEEKLDDIKDEIILLSWMQENSNASS